MTTSSLYWPLPGGGIAAHSGAHVPDSLHLLPAGVFRGRDGRGPYHVEDAEALIAASMAEGKLPLDENHATDHAMGTGTPSPARGWITELQARQDGVWGKVEWTEGGRALMSDQAYRGVSPVFVHDPKGRVIRLLRAALTNTPNLAQLATLHTEGNQSEGAAAPGHFQGEQMDLIQVRQALGLPETADEAACLAAMSETREMVARQSQQIEAMGKTAVPLDQVVALQAEVATMKASAAQERAARFVDAAITAGKPINATRAQYIALHVEKPDVAEAMINALPSINQASAHASRARHDEMDGDGEMMSETDKLVAKKMGIAPKAWREGKKKLRDANDGEMA